MRHPFPEGESLRLSCSGARTWNSCRRKYYLSYYEKLRGKTTDRPLQIGKVTHDLRHKYYMGEIDASTIAELDKRVGDLYPELSPQEAVEVAYEASTYLLGYLNKYRDDPLELISSEMKIELESVEPFTGRPYRMYGIVDAVCRSKDNRLWRDELKTTGRIDSYYLNGLKGGLQGGIYHHLLNSTMPEPIVGTIYSMIVKTKIPQYERMPVLMQKRTCERAIETFHGVARGIFEGDIWPNADSCFMYNRECPFITLCDALGDKWEGEWNEKTQHIKEVFYEVKRTDEEKQESEKESN